MSKQFSYPSHLPYSLFILLSLLGVIVGCTRVSQEMEMEKPAAPHGVQIELVEPLFPAAIGKEILIIHIYDADAGNQPIDNATIKVRGDMTHAGMVPILAESENGEEGQYEVLVDWSMSGDWILTVQATLPDGSIIEKSFPRTIANDPGDCEHEDKNTP